MAYQLSKDSKHVLEQVYKITVANPFSHERVELENQLLEKTGTAEPYHFSNQYAKNQTEEINNLLHATLQEVEPHLFEHQDQVSLEEKELYRYAVWFWIYHKYIGEFEALREQCESQPDEAPRVHSEFYHGYIRDLQEFLNLRDPAKNQYDPLCMNHEDCEELFAFCFQLWRGFHEIITRIVGRSESAAALRCETWEAIFTRRLLWSFRYVKDRMANFSTLILGPSGAGKDGVAAAIGYSQFIPFDLETYCFAVNPYNAYLPVNLSALSPTLIESELFGHTKGAFTGATAARKGMLEECSAYGALFLDEVGELSPEIQVKLLRVLQHREFHALGGGKARHFQGRIVSATNKDLSELVEDNRLREDFLYRLGSVVIRVPPLAQRFHEDPGEADELRHFIVERVLGQVDPSVEEELGERIADLVRAGYQWPGNIREFEQCIRSLIVKSSYEPLVSPPPVEDELEALFESMKYGKATIDDVLAVYCSHVYKKEGSYQSAAKTVDADWRTVKKYAELKEKS